MTASSLPPVGGGGGGGAREGGMMGGGPGGVMLSHLLHRNGIQSVVLETRSRDYVERRVRAGVLEQGSADLLTSSGVGARMTREGLVHDGIKLRFAGEEHRIDFRKLTGRGITVYGQQEVVKDLIKQRLADGGEIWFEAEATAIEGVESDRPRIEYRRNRESANLSCEVVAGCDGSHGAARARLEAKSYHGSYPSPGLPDLATTPPTPTQPITASPSP